MIKKERRKKGKYKMEIENKGIRKNGREEKDGKRNTTNLKWRLRRERGNRLNEEEIWNVII